MKSNQLIATRPEPNEYAPYYGKYVSLVPGRGHSRHAGKAVACNAGAAGPPGSRRRFPLCPGKVECEGIARDTSSMPSVSSATGHMRIARNDKTPLPASSRMTT